jgi:two-component system capsular synthesis response regulator RcsB
MIRKVLIAEDHESMNISLRSTLNQLGILNPDDVYYCDDAIRKIEKAQQINETYDLLITDLFFEKDSRDQKIADGIELIEAAKEIQPDLKIIVFTADSRPEVLEKLFIKFNIDGYVQKGRGDSKELMKAFENINNGQRYIPVELLHLLRTQKKYQFTDFDRIIILEMIKGKRQDEISDYLRENNITPSAKSSLEKRLKLIKETMGFNTNEQLIAYCVMAGVVEWRQC